MKTSPRIIHVLGLGAALALVFGLTNPRILAGPGPEYWRNLRNPKPEVAAAAAQPSGPVCTDAKIVTHFATRNAWPNGRGPLQVVAAGTKTVCTACGTFTVMKPSWHNGRGPLQPVQFAARHECTVACGMPAPATTL